MNILKKNLSIKGMLSTIRERFTQIKVQKEYQARTSNPISLTDCLMSALALFSLKSPSLLKFEEDRKQNETLKHNLKSLFEIKQVPSDTYMRERLDIVEPKQIRPIFKKLFAQAQRGKLLEEFTYFDGHYLMPMDMTGFFSSKKIHCENCCEKIHNRPQLKVLSKIPEDTKKLKMHTYILLKKSNLPWKVFFFNEKMIEIDINQIHNLFSFLNDKPTNKLSNNDKLMVNKIIENHHFSRHRKDNSYYHNMMCAVIAHPNKKTVLPFAPEPVIKSDGSVKNDCERNAAKRLISDIRREHPHLKLIAVQDSIASNYPNLKQLKDADMRFIVGVKPGDHKALFDWVNSMPCQEYSHETEDGKKHRYRYINNVPLNDKHHDFEVNFFEYWETDKNGKSQHFCWITDILITDKNIYKLMKGGRINWRIENNTFNTLKNQDYHFEHNFGHGYKYLSTVFAMLMMLAFFVDQIQEASCALFKKAREKYISRTTFWASVKTLFYGYFVKNWEDIFNAIAHGHAAAVLTPNTS